MRTVCAGLILMLCGLRLAAQSHVDTGVVVGVNTKKLTVVISCAEIPNYMAAMEMSFKVRRREELRGMKPGMQIRFDMVGSGPRLFALHLEQEAGENFEPESMQAGGLAALSSSLGSAGNAHEVRPGERVPDFTLTDQTGKPVSLSQFRNKVVAITFGYSRCPNPEYCLRLSNNLGVVERRFSQRAGRELILLTVAIDPEYDRGETLTRYADAFHADAAKWHFLTGSKEDIHRVASLFGMNFWRDEGLLTHSLHTVVINRQGELVANLEGNRFTGQQLADPIETELGRGAN